MGRALALAVFASAAYAQSPADVGTAAVTAGAPVTSSGTSPAAAPAALSAGSSSVAPAGPITELGIVDLDVGSGTEVRTGDVAYVHYTGWLYDPDAPNRRGRQFDSSHDNPIPFGFFVGVGKVIKGWDQGLPGMRVGGKRTLTVPPRLGYGEQGMGDKVPPNATLIFEIELVDVRQFARKG